MTEKNKLKVNNLKKRFKPLEKGFLGLFLILAIGLLVLSVAQFYRGLHNVDLVHNYAKLIDDVNDLNKELGGNKTIVLTPFDEATDTGSNFEQRPLADYYIIGMTQMEHGFELGLLAAIIIGLIIGRKL